MISQGVIAESIVSYKTTWTNPGKGEQPKWDQTDQSVVIHEVDVYPDLGYVSAYGAPQYLKYRSGANLTELLVAINQRIDELLSGKRKSKNEALALPPGPKDPERIEAGPELQRIAAGPDKPKAIAPGKQVHLLEPPKPEVEEPISLNPDHQGGKEEGEDQPLERGSYTVIVHGDKLRLVEVQEERGSYASGIKFIYKISNNLFEKEDDVTSDNSKKIWLEVKFPGLLGKSKRFEFNEFEEDTFKFGGNLLAQVLPTLELSFTPDPNSVYARETVVADIADLVKAANLTLSGKSDEQLKSDVQAIQDEIERRTAKPSNDPLANVKKEQE